MELSNTPTDQQKAFFDRIMAAVEERRTFAKMTRYVCESPIDLDLKIVEAIGKTRTPRFVIDDENRFTYENFIKWLRGDSSMKAIDPKTGNIIKGDLYKGIYIGGNTGSGKSWCLEIMREFAAACRFRVTYPGYDADRNEYLVWSCVRAKDICEHFAEKGNINAFKNRDILAIQDFGSEPAETLMMGNREDVIRQLIEYRGDTPNQITLITSNLRLFGGDKIRERYGDRVESRLYTLCNYFELKGKDRRKN